MIPVLTKLISWFISNRKLLAVTIIMILSAFLFLQHKQLKNKEQEIDKLYNNCLYYENKAAGIAEDNRTLTLTLDDLKQSKDSVVQELLATQKKLKIKDKELRMLQKQSQVIRHDTTVIVKGCDFCEVIKPNKLTSITINKKDSVLTTKLEIQNEQTLFVTAKREYKRKYKNWFSRLLHFDFKKITNSKYQIHNSNDLIITSDTRVINITQ